MHGLLRTYGRIMKAQTLVQWAGSWYRVVSTVEKEGLSVAS